MPCRTAAGTFKKCATKAAKPTRRRHRAGSAGEPSGYAPLAVGMRVRIEKGCNARGVTKGSTAVIKAIEPLGADYSHHVKVVLYFLNSMLSGKTVVFYARHPNRLSDPIVALNDGRIEHRIDVRRLDVRRA
jgi:hypothetical protein